MMRFEPIIAGATIGAAVAAAVSMLQPDTSLAVAAPAPLAVSTSPVPLNRDDPAQTRLGALQFRGAIQLRSTDPRFGGLSGLRAGPGNQMLAVSDTGNWFSFDTVERDGRLVGIADARLAPILGTDGKPAATKADGDAEALEWHPAAGTAAIVYEQDHRIVHFTGRDRASLRAGRTEKLTRMTGWPLNGGGEAMAELPGGTRIILAETARRPDGSRTALLTRGGRAIEIGITGVPDHSPTDAVALDGRRVLILHRRFTAMMGQGAALTLVDLNGAGAGTGKTLAAQLLARWEPPATLDNMEGLAIRRDAGRVFFYIVSDDNLNAIQRTLLMKFELNPAAIAAPATSSRTSGRP